MQVVSGLMYGSISLLVLIALVTSASIGWIFFLVLIGWLWYMFNQPNAVKDGT